MNPWIAPCEKLLRSFFTAPEALFYIQAGVALLFFLITFRLSGWALHVGYATWPRSLLAVLLLLGLPLALTVAFQTIAAPQLPPAFPARWILAGMLALLLLGVLIPLFTLLLKNGFFPILLMIVFSAFAAWVAGLLIQFSAAALQRGAGDLNKAGQRRDAVEQAADEPLSTAP